MVDLASLARQRVAVDAVPRWVVSCSYHKGFQARAPGPVAHLLIEQQVEAELGQVFMRTARRLESPQAVQHQAQWRLEFEPQTQSVVLHSVKIRRGETETDHLSLERIRFLDREAGLEGFVLDGWITLLLVLEDVLPGDILEWSCTITTRPRVLPEYLGCLFNLPVGVEVGKYHFSVRHGNHRAVRWKSSAADLKPTVENEGDGKRLVWEGTSRVSPEPEPFTPAWYLVFPWIQVSDCPDWQTVASGLAGCWKEEPAGEGLSRLVEEIKQGRPEPMARIDRAIELVQDEFRYLSVNLELGGRIPAPPETVIRRRYGDCKDLSFLLVRVLRELGVPARAVLVNAAWGRAIAEMLPSAVIFNHAVVEFEVGGEKRWVDATIKRQGGGALGRMAPDFGVGLPLEVSTTGLLGVPQGSRTAGGIELKESFLLDTAGGPSFISVLVTATGAAAERYRVEFENGGSEAGARGRLQDYANRFYAHASRVGKVEWRDDRQRNEFLFAEGFELRDLLKAGGPGGGYLLTLQGLAAAGVLALPTTPQRRAPFALPWPCTRSHVIEIEFTGMGTVSTPAVQLGNDFFTFSRRTKSLPKFLRVTFAFNTTAEVVPPERLAEYRKSAESVLEASTFRIRLQAGYARMRRRGDIVSLPPPPRGAAGPGARASTPLAASGQAGSGPARAGSAGTQPPARPPEASGPVLVQAALALEAPAKAKPTPERIVATPRRKRGSAHLDQGGRTNPAILWSFVLALTGTITVLSGMAVQQTVVGPGLFGVGVRLSQAAFLLSAGLVILGLRQCSRHPVRYRSGITLGVLSLSIDLLFLLLTLPALLWSPRATQESNEPLRTVATTTPGLIKAGSVSATFAPLAPPWRPAPGNRPGGNHIDFVRPDGLRFGVAAGSVPPEPEVGLRRAIELLKGPRKDATILVRQIAEGERTHNEAAGWQIENELTHRGKRYYEVIWLMATNGVAFRLTTLGPLSRKDEVKEEATGLCSRFRLLPARETNALGNSPSERATDPHP